MKKGGFKKLLALFLVLAAVIPLGTVSAAAARETSAVQTAATTSTGSLTADEFRAEVVRLVNIERENAGVKILTIMDKLTEVANVRAEESRRLSHIRGLTGAGALRFLRIIPSNTEQREKICPWGIQLPKQW